MGLFLVSCGITDISRDKDEIVDYVSFVNPLMGTDSNYELSNGNTYPAIARPWEIMPMVTSLSNT
jgi:hypothetical protein